MGRSESGKTTLTQVLNGESVSYDKTQYIKFDNCLIDTPGEYAQTKGLGHALALYAYEADVVGLLVSSTEPYCLFPPCCTAMANREVIGIVTKIDVEGGDKERAERWLKLAGCKTIFFVNSKGNEGIVELLEYLKEDGDILPCEV